MASLNKITVIGNVGKEPEMRFTPAGKPVTSFSVATSNRYQKEGEWQSETQWFNVVAWNRLAETCNQFIEKGKQVYVEGRLQMREWEGKEGERRYSLEIIANTVLFLGKKEGIEQDGKVIAKVETSELEPEGILFRRIE